MTTYLGDNVTHHQPFNPIWDLSKLFWYIEDIHLRQEESYNQKKKIKNSNFSFALLSASSSSVHNLILGLEFRQFSSPSQVNKINQDSPKFRYNIPNKVVIS